MTDNRTSAPTDAAAKSLRTLLDGVLPSHAVPDITVTDVTIDSRAARAGAAFIALAGTREHGLSYAKAAVERGAVVVLYEAGAQTPTAIDGVPAIALPDAREAVGLIADRFFDAPSSAVSVIGVTGTNGKTTTAWLIAQAVELLGSSAAYAGTLGVGRIDRLQTRSHTTPDSITIHRELAALRADGVSTLGMEVSSHALDQSRVAGVRFEGAVFTNLTHDHLDYHGSLAAYGATKAKLFQMPGLRYAVINSDDGFGRTLIAQTASRMDTVAYSRGAIANSSVRRLCAGAVQLAERGIEIRVDGDFGSAWLHSRLIGDFNVDNLLATLGVLLSRGVSLKDAVGALSQVTAPPGRMQTFTRLGAPLAVVDYAHTPDALAKALAAARAHTSRKLVVVFGCGGERDPAKRPVMGHIASELADRVIVTDDNPRGEDGQQIVEQILHGMPANAAHVERDRKRAIELALNESTSGDVVLVAGKGHEDYQIVGTERRHFSDAEVIQDWLEQLT